MRINAYRGPFMEHDADNPTLELDIQVAEPTVGWSGEHGAAVKIYGAELIGVLLPFLKALGIEERPHGQVPWEPRKS